jgi:hypothetical protein
MLFGCSSILMVHFLTYVIHFPLVSPVHLDSYITSYLFAQGSLTALMMEEARNSETSVNTYLTTRQYIPEDYELHWQEMSENFAYKYLCSYLKGYLTCRKILRHRADGFFHLRKKSCYEFYGPKNVSSSNGIEPANLESSV